MARILVADIGGTNCRLGLFTAVGDNLTMVKNAWVRTDSIQDEETFILALEREMEQKRHECDVIVAAIAGPVEGNAKGRLSNGALRLDFGSEDSGRFFLINDFMAQAHAVLSPQGARARHIAGPKAADGTRAVLGAGTGLGQATLLRQGGGWLIAPSENGHANFPFVGEDEEAFHSFLRQKLHLGYATGDDTITGRGLAALHQFLTGDELAPAQVGAQALSHESETLRWYARFYGRACRNWILTAMCEGGLWIAGGIAAQNPLAVTSAHFLAEMYNAPDGSDFWASFLRGIPVYLQEDTNSGLWGAAHFGQEYLRHGA